MTDKTSFRNDGRCEYAIQTGAEKEGSCPAGNCAMPCDNSAAHLTIPGALEWDGDNGTHGVVGTHGADGESSELDRLRALSVTNILMAVTPGFDGMGCEHYARSVGEVEQKLGELSEQAEELRAQLANTEQSRRSFFDLSQGLEKRLAERDALMNRAVQAWAAAETINNMDSAMAALRDALSASAEPSAADDIPDFTPGSGNKARRRIEAIQKAKGGGDE